MPEFIYFIVCTPEGYRKDEFALKVGMSDNVRETRVSLEEAGWVDLKTYAVYSGKNIERQLDLVAKKFELTSLRRGWYRVKRADLDDFLKPLDKDETLTYYPESRARVSKRSTKADDSKEETTEEKPAKLKPAKAESDEKPAKSKPAKTESDEKPTKSKPAKAESDEKPAKKAPKSADEKPSKSKPTDVEPEDKPSKKATKSAEDKPAKTSKRGAAKSEAVDETTVEEKPTKSKSKSSTSSKPASDRSLEWD